MQKNVEPAANGELGRVLPGLSPVAMIEVVCWFPVVEDLVAILDGRKESSCHGNCREDVECNDRFNVELAVLQSFWPV